MQKCPKMSIVVTPAVGSLLTEPPGNHFMPQLAVPSFIVPGVGPHNIVIFTYPKLLTILIPIL